MSRGAAKAGLWPDLAAAIDRSVAHHGGNSQDALDLAQMCRRALDEIQCRTGTATTERTAKPRRRQLEELSGHERGHLFGPGSWPAISAALSAAADSGAAGASTRDLASSADLEDADAGTVADGLRSVGLLIAVPGASGSAERYCLPERLMLSGAGGGR